MEIVTCSEDVKLSDMDEGNEAWAHINVLQLEYHLAIC
jgi:hypothetical protein